MKRFVYAFPLGIVFGQSLSQEALDAHNTYRVRHQVDPLVWDDAVAASAQSWADGCVFEHSGVGYGENLAWGHSSMKAAIDVWYDEVSRYDYSNPVFSAETGHFTQVVWKNSKRIGCAKGNGCSGNYWVCQYDPPGNYLGQFAENVLPAVDAPPPETTMPIEPTPVDPGMTSIEVPIETLPVTTEINAPLTTTPAIEEPPVPTTAIDGVPTEIPPVPTMKPPYGHHGHGHNGHWNAFGKGHGRRRRIKHFRY